MQHGKLLCLNNLLQLIILYTILKLKNISNYEALTIVTTFLLSNYI